MSLSNDKKKMVLWFSVSVITVIIMIVWGFFFKKNFNTLKIQLQQKKELSPEHLQFKKDLEELKKSLKNVQQGISNIKTTVENENKKIEEQKLSSEQIKN
jgi:peptidoglycan hydrolase CwlO-like protein